ncbi:hypothetical protein X797_004652 [Metarhizium robertsii]|uniref:P-loop containing nucleoside triphosphate hydrolase protein n=2 Tax=Metarhizium robertsii TaxID=568076 RepID=E9ET36_METRA|nr:uncharacterized protein MAA_03236 [Metarhizium robertsii ARSEF 23]EFZ02007.1 hypothetical protein MAA_03236 [Metarhizium robertsii ARSEF 23]EXV02519.1 hypothetical protein X797_004652 [Metarhizium robertsii]
MSSPTPSSGASITNRQDLYAPSPSDILNQRIYICTNTIVEAWARSQSRRIYIYSPPAPDSIHKPSRPTAPMRVIPSFLGFNRPPYRKGLMICGFPGIGKSELADQPLLVPYYTIVELHSSKYLKDKYGNDNANFVADYCGKLSDACRRNTIVLASTHHEVLSQLYDQSEPMVFIYPFRSEKDKWIARLQSRGASEDLVNLVRDDWDALMDDFTRWGYFSYNLRSDEYLLEEINGIVTDILNRLEVLMPEIEAEEE